MAIPPELMAQLQAGGGPPDAGAAPPPDLGGGPPSAGDAGGGGDGAGVAEDPAFTQFIKQAIAALKQAADTNEDDTDKALAAECMSKLQSLLGTHQKQRDAALGITDVHRGVRRAIRGAQGGPGGPGGY